MISRVLKQVVQNTQLTYPTLKIGIDDFGTLELDGRKVCSLADLNITPYPGNEVETIQYMTDTVGKRLVEHVTGSGGHSGISK